MTRLGVGAALGPTGWVAGDVEIVDGAITAIGLDPPVGSRLAVPGLVDLQVNGYAGIDVAGADVDELVALRRAVARDGVTAFSPTLISADSDDTAAALGRLDHARQVSVSDGARVLGAHLEGPFLSPARSGTHPPRHLRAPDTTLLARLVAAGDVALLTLAPELDGAVALVTAARRAGVTVLAGHSDTDAATAHAGFDAGVAGATHLFNAMSGAHHRTPGLALAALARQDIVVTVIADGHHLHPDVVRLVSRAAAGRWVLVTDATAAAGMPDGPFRLGDVDVVLAEGAVRNQDGTLAGSAATLAGGVRAAVAAGVGLVETLLAATATPIRLLPPHRRPGPDAGRLRPGGVADVTVLDDTCAVTATFLSGVEIAPREL